MARVNAFLRRRGEHKEPDSLQFGEFFLDSAAHKLFRGGEEVDTHHRKSSSLLEYFLSRQGRALTRDDILRNVWGNSIMVTGRSVDRCVTTLRSKIEADPRRPAFIHTVRDIGYRFEAVDFANSSGSAASP